MKKSKNFYIAMIIIFLVFSCRKMDVSNIKIVHDFRFYNKTNDTFFCKKYWRNSGDIPLHLVTRFYFVPNQYKTYAPYSTRNDSLFIYKLSDTLNPYVVFKRNHRPYNYKIDLNEFSNWDSIVNYEIKTIDKNIKYYELNVIYYFEFKKENIINE